MNRKPLLAVGGVGLLALAVTVGLFAAGGEKDSRNSKVVGKLSKETIELETTYRQLQDKWRTNEAAFRDPKNSGTFPDLAALNVGFAKLAREAPGLKGDSDIEKAALPHLVKSVEAAAKVPSVFIMAQVNPAVVQQSSWAEAKANAETANAEWKTWLSMTEGLTR